MKKILLSAALVAACSAVSAQKLTYIPWTENALMMGTTISANGKYVGGCDTEGRAFLHSTTTGETKYFYSPDLEEGGEGVDADLRSITNDGVGVGYLENTAAKFNFATGEYTKVLNENSLLQVVNPEGSFMAGFTYDKAYRRYPFYMTDDEKKSLPMPTIDFVGYEFDGATVTAASQDGSVIVGALMDNFASFPLVIWSRNADEESYSVQIPSRRFFDGSIDMDGAQPYDWFEGAAVSSDGRWIAVNIHKKGYDDPMVIGRYDVLNDTVEIINCPEGSATNWYYATGIADNGTIVGYVENQRTQGREAMICKSGETEAKYMSEEFPTLTDLATMDMNQLNSPCAITPDGRYIVGYGYVDYDDENLCLGTWYIDTQYSPETGINSVENKSASSKVVASYSLDGKKLNHIEGYRGVVINKLADGRVRKTIK